tara:strand:+ start:800 stop:1021 length:222 start_codon:yes stop_codon:yes gene_type:complete
MIFDTHSINIVLAFTKKLAKCLLEASEVSFASQKSDAKGTFASRTGKGGKRKRVCMSKGLNSRGYTYTYGKLE